MRWLPIAGACAFAAMIAWAAGCASEAPPRGGCPPTTYRSGAICAPILGTHCPEETHFVDGGGCVSDRSDAGAKDGDDDDDFPAPWFVGRWAMSCRASRNVFRIERSGPTSVRQAHEKGSTHELKILVKGDTLELHGTSTGGKHVLKYRILDHQKLQHIHRYFDGADRPAYGVYEKCD